ncbi:hypothetical protein FACS1894172_18160 [Spirochaetia bacterium]|nr:hypothetical protein FACS1894164_13120 [Spirochaetia bacterium]GHU35863.1 hypothetical protein FACS1894172_18160 [Spirochaetia bacterium]
MLEIPYRGTGWVYLGEARAQRGMVYDSRRLDAEGQTFLFRVNAAGTFALKFYKQDFIRDYILNDLVQVIASEPPEFSPTTWFNPPAQQSRIVAGPRWPSALEEAAAVGAVRAPAPAAPPVHPEQLSDAALDSPPSEPPEQPPEQAQDPHTYFTQAQTAFEAGDLEPALSRLDLFREHYPTGTDEAWWLYGQIFEAPGANRNIRSAVTYYQRLVQEFPWSSRISDAKKRIAYLERFYVNIQ